MAQSRAYKKTMNFVYGMGAAVVIVGALFKIQHMSIGPITGGVMLTIGLLVEALVFVISAFDTPEEEFDWSKLYPELGDEKEEKEEVSTEGMLSQKLDALLKEANIDASLMESLGKSMKNFQGAAEGLSSASEAISSTNKYNKQMTLAAGQMETLNTLYKIQAENVGKQSELNGSIVDNTEKLKIQMDSLAKNLSSLNGVYGGMLSAMSK